jgi:Uncharacterized protein conserved in bacteria
MSDWQQTVESRLSQMDLVAEVHADAAAWYSADDRYRYALLRRWSEAAPDVWVMANPSTATATTDDPTIRRVCGYSRRWGAGGVVVVNLFGYRSTDPAMLDDVDDPVGPLCDPVIDAVTAEDWRTILAWGTPGRRLGRPDAIIARLEGPLHCLTQLEDGSPGHPLFKSGELTPTRYLPRGRDR